MGQNSSLPDTVDAIQYEFMKHTKVFGEIKDLEFDEFIKSILELNELWVLKFSVFISFSDALIF